MKIKKEIQEILDKPITRHPSRETELRVCRLEKAILLLAEKADLINRTSYS